MSKETKQILITGRARSGTSLTAGICNKLGVDMGISRKGDNNPNYYEEKEFYDYLQKKKFGEIVYKHKGFEKWFREYVERKKRDVWGIKNGRMMYYLPVVLKVLDNPFIIITHRNHKHQAQSIYTAIINKPLPEIKKTIKKWYKNCDKVLKDYDLPVLHVKFEKYFKKPEEQIKKIATFLDLPYNQKAKYIIDDNHRHYK